jgi:uncharacterized protein (DUF697 family)
MALTDTLKREVTEIELRGDMSTEEKVERIIHITCGACAAVAIQPLPFADIFILTPIQAYMGTRIAATRGVPVDESEVTDLIKEIAGVVGMGVIAQQTAIGLFKIILPWLGGLMTLPLVYGLSYAIMRVIDAWYEAKSRNTTLTVGDIRHLWKSARSEDPAKGQAQVRQTGSGDSSC